MCIDTLTLSVCTLCKSVMCNFLPRRLQAPVMAVVDSILAACGVMCTQVN